MDNLQEKRDSILTEFILGYFSKRLEGEDNQGVGVFDAGIDLIIYDINNQIENAESLSNKMMIYISKKLGKLTLVDGGAVIKNEDTIINYSNKEREFKALAMDVIAQFIQHCVAESNLSEQDVDNWDLDMINFCGKFTGAESIKFENGLGLESFDALYRS